MSKVVIIGGGPAGMQAAATLKALGHSPVIIERRGELGGKLRKWHNLFPTFTPAKSVLDELKASLGGVEVRYEAEVTALGQDGVALADGRYVYADAILIATGFDLFKAERKEEYGYGIYENIYTSVDIERMFNEDRVCLADGRSPSRIALLHCVGSRDEKVNQRHCSRVCCITGVKQAIELKERFPQSEIYNFYMDMRMFGPGYEEMYRTAQEDYNIHFIRGRISEAGETIDKRIQIKAEDTLLGRPLRMTVDMLVLLVGMSPGESNQVFCGHKSLETADSGFMKPVDSFTNNLCCAAENIFYAGAVTAPKNVGESINEGTAAAIRVANYLKSRK